MNHDNTTLKRYLKGVWSTAIGMALFHGQSQAAEITFKVEGLIQNVIATSNVDTSTLPFKVGDPMEYVFTFDDQTPGTTNYDGSVTYEGAIISSNITAGSWLGSSSSGDIGIQDMSNPPASNMDGFWAWSEDPPDVLVGDPVAGAVAVAWEAHIRGPVDVESDCITSISLPTAPPDPGDCSESLFIIYMHNGYAGGEWVIIRPVVSATSWSVLSPLSELEDLVSDVVELNLKQGLSNALDAKLDAAFQSIDDLNSNNGGAAVGSLQAFIYFVEAQRGKEIADEEADALIKAATDVIAMIEGQ